MDFKPGQAIQAGLSLMSALLITDALRDIPPMMVERRMSPLLMAKMVVACIFVILALMLLFAYAKYEESGPILSTHVNAVSTAGPGAK